jgi:hypothetical protein
MALGDHRQLDQHDRDQHVIIIVSVLDREIGHRFRRSSPSAWSAPHSPPSRDVGEWRAGQPRALTDGSMPDLTIQDRGAWRVGDKRGGDDLASGNHRHTVKHHYHYPSWPMPFLRF